MLFHDDDSVSLFNANKQTVFSNLFSSVYPLKSFHIPLVIWETLLYMVKEVSLSNHKSFYNYLVEES
jgi:hypothetical protein